MLIKLEKELPRYLISFIEDDFVVDSEFSISDNTMDITDPREIAHNITYKGVNYKLIGHKENQYKIQYNLDQHRGGLHRSILHTGNYCQHDHSQNIVDNCCSQNGHADFAG